MGTMKDIKTAAQTLIEAIDDVLPEINEFLDRNKIYDLPFGFLKEHEALKSILERDNVEFKRTKKPDDATTKSLADYSDNELQVKMDAVKAEIEHRRSQNNEIIELARKICADNDKCNGAPWLAGHLDDVSEFQSVKAAIIAGMELQKEREA